jgi:hypothetical protein
MIPKNRRIVLQGEDIEEVRGTTRTHVSPVLGGMQEITIPVTGDNTGTVIFEVQPNVSESGSVSYFEIGDIRQAANLLVYMGSPSREFSINGRFVSRTVSEAATNLTYVRRLRAWRMPEKTGPGINLKTPSRLKLRGLGDWFKNIHVRIVSLSIEEPEDVDYIRVGSTDVPIVWPVTVSLKETRSVDELRQFNIEKFRTGKLDTW